MKFLSPIFLVILLLLSNNLAAYSNIPEYSSNTSVFYSNIGCYFLLVIGNVASSENEIDDVNSEVVCENSESIQESGELAENPPMMMARGPLTYNGQLKLDDDGHGSSHGDPLHKSTTALQRNGKSLNPDYDSYVVAPSWLLAQGVRPGDRADVTAYFTLNRYENGILVSSQPWQKTIQSIVGDTGPADATVGEISIKAALDLGFSFRDIPGKGPIPTYKGSDADIYVTVTYYPSRS